MKEQSPPRRESSPRNAASDARTSREVKFHDNASAIYGDTVRSEQLGVSKRQTSEVVKVAQAYVSALNRQPPPPPPGGGAGCRENCCWRWLTAMLLQELQLLRRTVADAREAFVEQERTFASLNAVPDEKDYAALIEQHKQTQKEHQDLSSEYPELQTKIVATHEAVDGQREDIRLAEVEVARLKELLKSEEDKQQTLQTRLKAAEKEVDRTRQTTAELQAEFEETEKKKHRQEVLMEMVVSDHAILEAQRECLQVGSRGAKKKGAAAAGKAAAAPSPAPAASGGDSPKGKGEGPKSPKSSKK